MKLLLTDREWRQLTLIVRTALELPSTSPPCPGPKKSSPWTPQTLHSFALLQSCSFSQLLNPFSCWICVHTQLEVPKEPGPCISLPQQSWGLLMGFPCYTLLGDVSLRLMRRNIWRVPGRKSSCELLWRQTRREPLWLRIKRRPLGVGRERLEVWD